MPDVELPKPVTAVEGVKWEDDYFTDTEGIIAVFDFDYEKTINFFWDVQKAQYCIAPHLLILTSLCCGPCIAYMNIEWSVRAQHVAVHRDGIKYITDKRKAGCGFSCQDVGKNSKTVPFDKLTDCDVQEPAGTAVCCMVPNVLTSVTVDTASGREMSLVGLKDAHAFKTCVWDCKRGAVNLTGSDGIRGVGSMAIGRDGGGADMRSDDVVPLLRGIHEELKKQTELLEGRK
jgi:hypothetical protein